MTLRSRISSVLVCYWEVLLIYPALFLYIFSTELNLISQHGLIYRKLCLNDYNETVCNSIHNFTNASHHVQEQTSEKLVIFNVAFLMPAIFSIIHLASWADRRLDYEIPLLVSLVGSLGQSFICIWAVQAVSYELSFYLIVLAQIINGICGAGSLSFISSCFSHVAMYDKSKYGSNTSPSNHSIRYSICESCLLLGQFLGSFLSGYLIGNKINLENFQRVYILSFSIYLFVLLYTILMFRLLKKPKKNTMNSESELEINQNDEDDLESERTLRQEKLNCLKNQFKFVSETWQILRKPRLSNSRFLLNSLLLLFFLGSSISMGIMSVQYLYLIKPPISLTQIDYGYFKALNTLFRACALLIVLPFLKRFISAPDFILFIMGFTSEFLNLVVFSLAHFFNYIIWLAPIFYMFSNYFVVCIRSYASKLVDKNETGKYFALIGVVEFLVLLTSSSLFSYIYRYTVSVFAPFVFLLGCFIAIFICYPFLM